MTPSAQDLFVQALEMEPAVRDAFLAQACGDDAELHLEVQRLLVDAERADSFFGDEDGATLGAEEFKETYAEKEGDVIGPYKLRQAIGEGGFGTVWMAEQSVPISRMVALKVIKAGMDTKQVLARFEAERQALAMMDHPHIAKVLDAGATPTGRPWFAMELVKGIPITDYCDEAGLGTKERLALFRDVCSAINHAHQKGVIHRDIKPSNVMVISVTATCSLPWPSANMRIIHTRRLGSAAWPRPTLLFSAGRRRSHSSDC
jgi:serine/threonine protein kinase